MTGFTPQEEQLGRMVAEAMRRGVPRGAFGLGGMRSVGPLVTLQVVDGHAAYRTNGTPGITLGRFLSESRETVRRIYRENLPATIR